VLHEDPVTLAQAVDLLPLRAGLLDDADVLVAHDHRRVDGGLAVQLDVGAADAGDLDPEQRGVVRDLGHRELPELRRPGSGPDRCQHLLCHACSSHLGVS
jgi:hypothetical protein